MTGGEAMGSDAGRGVAEAIRDALAISQQERVSRWQSMIGPLRDRDVSWWAAAFLKELAAAERMQGDRLDQHSSLI